MKNIWLRSIVVALSAGAAFAAYSHKTKLDSMPTNGLEYDRYTTLEHNRCKSDIHSMSEWMEHSIECSQNDQVVEEAKNACIQRPDVVEGKRMIFEDACNRVYRSWEAIVRNASRVQKASEDYDREVRLAKALRDFQQSPATKD